jgi:uncharacterized protein (DUF58 family)
MNSTTSTITPLNAGWDGPGAPDRRERFSWHRLVWLMVFPRRRHRIALTIPGVFLMALAMGIGTAAYNTASNILFITLSLLLACLLLSGLLSWFNFMGMSWRMRPPGAWRAGHETLVTIEILNGKRWLPTYSLWFELASQPKHIPEPDAGGRELTIREILVAAEKHITRGKVYLRDRVEPGATVTLDWVMKPLRRGEAVVELAAVGSLFPFGFLQKSLGTAVSHPVLVWPAQVEYQWIGAVAAHAGTAGRRTSRVGIGDDLLALRKYELGDSHRLIHWKASARLGQLMIRQFAAETHEGYVLRLDSAAGVWKRPEQFELVCSLAATLAEDLFAAGRLRGIVLDDGSFLETRRLRDLEAWLDALALLQPRADFTPNGPEVSFGHNLITFAPDGARGVAAYVDGRKTASA